jgi:hypothetical protein
MVGNEALPKDNEPQTLRLADLYYYAFAGALWGLVAYFWLDLIIVPLLGGSPLDSGGVAAASIFTIIGEYGRRTAMNEVAARVQARKTGPAL